jgi:hypothetical protein
MTAIADVRIHGTTHERPVDRFVQEQPLLLTSRGQPSFRLEARQVRVVAADYLVSLDTNRYSVPFTLIGQTVDVLRRAGMIEVFHRGQPVATHPELAGKHQLRILPEHGPGAIARITRQRASTLAPPLRDPRQLGPAVEVRDLSLYEAASRAGAVTP